MRKWFSLSGPSRSLPAVIAVASYLLVFAPMRAVFGDAVGSLSVIPVLVAGIYMSRKATWLVALGLTLMNGLLFATIVTNPSPGREWYGSVLGTVSLFVTADLVGRARSASLRLKNSGESKDEFLAGVSHELRTPLTAIVGYSSLLRSDLGQLDKSEVASVIELIHQQSTDMASIVEDLLIGTRLDNQELTFAETYVHLNVEVEKALASLSVPVGTSLTVSVPESACVIGDPSRIRQILRNVISNAFRHGGAEVAIRTSETESTTTISVGDSGAALHRDEWESVFDPYYRSHNQPGQPDSVGLGLTVSRRLARAMGGDLIYRGVDDTSEFILLLPTSWTLENGDQRSGDELWLQPAARVKSA